MTTLEQTEAVPTTRTAVRRTRRSRFATDWWRYLIGLVAIAFAIFPILYVISAAFNPVDSLSGTSLIPENVTLDNFRAILSGNPGEEGSSEAALDVPYKN
jgi:arabinogalactan oligomer/maltooligosaccharide transport system permease protein